LFRNTFKKKKKYLLVQEKKNITKTRRMLNVLSIKRRNTNLFCMSPTATVRMDCFFPGLQLFMYPLSTVRTCCTQLELINVMKRVRGKL